MPGFPVRASSVARACIAPAATAVGILLSGCAMEPVREAARPAPACRVDSVLYCELDFHLEPEQCQCVRRGAFRDAVRTLTRR